MSRIVIAYPPGAVSELLHIALDLHGHVSVDHDDVGVLESDVDALIVDPVWPTGLARAHELRRSNPDVPIICVSVHPPTQEAKELLPVSYVTMPFRLADLELAVRLALEP